MKYYRNPATGEVFAYESDGSQDAYIASSLVRMTPEQVSDHLANAAQQSPVPERVTMRQARLALLGAGLLDAVEAAINGMPGDQGKAARIEWDYSSEMVRSRPFVQQLGAAIGLSSSQIDQLFIAAAGIE